MKSKINWRVKPHQLQDVAAFNANGFSTDVERKGKISKMFLRRNRILRGRVRLLAGCLVLGGGKAKEGVAL